MARKLLPSPETVARQRRAADPSASAWVSANAGSGKTYVLANRVIRLLLSGVAPSRILCLTFTKAAAAHMSNTVFKRLAAWAVADDASLRAALTELGEDASDTALPPRARRLFARALDTPGGLKVLTIHAFCERILHQFPFEARVPAAFSVLDDRLRADLVAAARDDVLMLAADKSDAALAQALSRLVGEVSDATFGKALNEVLWQGEHLADLMRPEGADARARVETRLQRALGVGQGQSVAAIDAEILDAGIPQRIWAELTGWLRSGGKSDGDLAECLVSAASETNNDLRRTLYLGLCLTKDLKPRSDRAFVTKKLRDTRPDLYNILLDERARLGELIEQRRAAATAERSFALLTVADAIWTRYSAEKARRGALDFSDLISATGRLLKDHGAAWVHFKLDQGIDHVLVDEAQDTSPDQWAIVQLLTSEFTAGAGAREGVRTVFAVGDEKQSIFGFQGAAPEMFARVRSDYARLHREAVLDFHVEPLTQSFRTTQDVLTSVDEVFSRPEAFTGLQSDNVGPQHETARVDAPGEVQVWPLIEPDAEDDADKPWFLPLDSEAEKSPLMRHAQRIADAVKGWTEGRDALGPCEPISEGQILILVRSRGALFEAILRELKNRNLKVAGADRLDIGKHIAVLDLLALADAILLPSDDLQLASVLKSPLFGMDDEDLMRIAPGRRGSLRGALRGTPEDDRLVDFSRLARRLRPFDFYAHVLGAGGGRKAFRARLGHEVDDVLDEFLRLAMTYGENETATLAGFAAWMRAAPAEIKRDLETAGEDVRVMTVHGSKGLEAKLVVLADFGAERAGTLAPSIYSPDEPDRRADEAELLVWSLRTKDDPDVIRQAREAEKERERGEHRRLLYVGLTRAEDRLVIAAHAGKRPRHDGSWHRLVTEALGAPFSEEHEVPALGGTVLVRRGAPLPMTEPKAPKAHELALLPGWLFAPLPKERAEAEFAAPSRALEHAFSGAASPRGEIAAKDRGVFLHRLLEELPKLAPEARREAAERYLARREKLSGETRAALIDEALHLLADPQLAALLAKPGRAEVPVAGDVRLRDGTDRRFLGLIDRLIVDENRVTVLDFKSDRPVPSSAPDSYVAQLALYRALVQRLYPGREVVCALLWTVSGRLDMLSTTQLDAALLRVGGMAPIP